MSVFGSSNRPKDKLPLEHMSLDDDLRFFLEIFYNMEIVDHDCEGFYAGVMLDNNRKLKMGVNINALDEFPIPEELYILVHEGGHIVFDHLIRGERMVNKKALNIAADAVLNSILNRHYPQIHMPRQDGKEIGITLELLLKEKMIKQEDLDLLKKSLEELTTDDVYEIIMRNAAEQEDGQGQGGNQCSNCGEDMDKPPKQGKGQQDSQTGEGKPNDAPGDNPEDKPQSGNNPEDKPQPGNGKATCPHCGKEHDAQQGQGSGQPGQGKLNELDKRRIDNHEGVTAEDVDEETRQQISEIIRQAKSGMYGDKAGNFVRDLMNAVKKEFPFKEILDKIIQKIFVKWPQNYFGISRVLVINSIERKTRFLRII